MERDMGNHLNRAIRRPRASSTDISTLNAGVSRSTSTGATATTATVAPEPRLNATGNDSTAVQSALQAYKLFSRSNPSSNSAPRAHVERTTRDLGSASALPVLTADVKDLSLQPRGQRATGRHERHPRQQRQQSEQQQHGQGQREKKRDRQTSSPDPEHGRRHHWDHRSHAEHTPHGQHAQHRDSTRGNHSQRPRGEHQRQYPHQNQRERRAYHSSQQPDHSQSAPAQKKDYPKDRPQHTDQISAKRFENGSIMREWDRDVQDENFTVMTYNLLARSLASANKFLYRHCRPATLSWKNRSRVLLAELESRKLDIYCFQELDAEDYHRLFEPTFKRWGYTGFYKKRNGDKYDGCALFYNADRVKAETIIGVDYNTNAFIDRDNVGIVAMFEIKHGKSTRKVCVATTHILFNQKRGMIKIAQLRVLLETAQSLIERTKNVVPIVLCGDMNSLPGSTVLDYLMQESIDVSMINEMYMSGQVPAPIGTARPFDNAIREFRSAFGDGSSSASLSSFSSSKPSILSQPFHLVSAYDLPDKHKTHKKGGGPFWTTYHGATKQTCDFILYGQLRSTLPFSSSSSSSLSPAVNSTTLKLAACLELPCKLLERAKGLPTDDFASDHLSLVSKFRFI